MKRCLTAWSIVLCALVAGAAWADERPNVVLIITDDQGYGDLGAHGNAMIRTPRLDRLAAESVQLANFHVSPVCSPTRASLLTGRYNYRTGVTDTYQGRSIMDPAERTLAERLRDAGYRTGIFGKWHLGDNYPCRAIDQGFDEALVHRGGGIGQPSDPPEARSYFDPVLSHNGRAERQQGYVSDVITDAAIGFVEQNRQRPFFLYLAFNAPHVPLEVPQRYRELYDAKQITPEAFPHAGQALPRELNGEVIAKVYAMVTNIDDNVGRLLDALDERQLSKQTIVVFLTDNGPQQPRYNAGMRNLKGSVYEGGIRVPCFVRYSGTLQPKIDGRLAAHIDLTPTLLEACGARADDTATLDGRSLWAGLREEPANWPARTLFWQWHRGNEPQRYRNFAARTSEWKLLRGDSGRAGAGKETPFELYHLASDPYETKNVAAENPAIVEQLRGEYERWFDDVGATRGYEAVRTIVGSDDENPVTLTPQDWRRNDGSDEGAGWELTIDRSGEYRLTAFASQARGDKIGFTLAGQERAAKKLERRGYFDLGTVELKAGPLRIPAELDLAGESCALEQLTIERVGGE